MARCKCKKCQAQLDTTTAYKVVVVGPKSGKETSQYYCSEAEWKAEEDRKNKVAEDRNRVYFLICDMFGYEIQNTKFFAEWVLWNKLKSDEIIYKYLRENETYLQQVCEKSYNTEYQRIMYFSAILKNSLRDFKPKVTEVEKPKVVVEEHYETKYKPKARAALLDFEEDCE